MKSIFLFFALLGSLIPIHAEDKYAFAPDTTTIKSSWQDFFKDQIYLNLSTTTKREVTEKLFTDLFSGDTTYLSWNYGLQQEAKRIFFNKAGFQIEVDASKLSAETIARYDNESAVDKTQKLGAAIVRANEARLPSPAVDMDKTIPKTEIPRTNVKKFAMPVGRSWFSNPLDDLQNDPAFIGYIAIMNKRQTGY